MDPNKTGFSHHNYKPSIAKSMTTLGYNHIRNRSSPNIILVGYIGDPQFHQLKEASQKANQLLKGKLQIDIEEQNYEADYDMQLKSLKRTRTAVIPAFKFAKKIQLGAQTSQHSLRPAYFLVDNKPIFDFKELLGMKELSKNFNGNSQNITPKDQMQQLQSLNKGQSDFKDKINNQLESIYKETDKRSFVYMDIKVGTEQDFRIVIELYKNIAPKSCKNFQTLCSGFKSQEGQKLHYKHTKLHRIHRFGFVQGGILDDGKKHHSIYGGYFEDEGFAVKHDRPGVVGLTNKGVPHSNGSQFYITLGRMEAFDGRMVAFGRVVQGLKNFQKMNKLRTINEIPADQVIIKDCGKFYFGEQPVVNPYNQLIRRVSQDSKGSDSPKSIKSIDTPCIDRKKLFAVDQLKITQKSYKTLDTYIQSESKNDNSYSLLLQTLVESFDQIHGRLMRDVITTKEQLNNFVDWAKEHILEKLEETDVVSMALCTFDQEIVPMAGAGKYIVSFNPLDVTEPYDLQNCGSIFSIIRKVSTIYKKATQNDILQDSSGFITSGYAFYGQTCVITLCDKKVNVFTKDQEQGEYILTHSKVKHSKKTGLICMDEGKTQDFDKHVKTYLRRRKQIGYYSRYSGSIVADFHRVLLQGGVYMQPPVDDEAGVNIMDAMSLANIIDKAWERHSSGQDGQFFSKKPKSINESISVYFGVAQEILDLENMYLSIRRKNSVLQQNIEHSKF